MSARVKDVSDDFIVEDAAPSGRQVPVQRESDPHRLAQRQKQIDLGKNTLGYQRYREAVPRDRRNRKSDPMTPDVYQVCSKRAFEGQVKKWRRMLHAWDPPATEEEEGEPALLPVVADLGGCPGSSNPPPPGAEPSDDFEHISHADACSPPELPKNGRALLRPAGNQLPLKIPSAVRKRAYDETVGGSSEGQRQQQQQHCQHLSPHSAQPARLQPDAKQQRRSVEQQPHERERGGGQLPQGRASSKQTPAAAAAARGAQKSTPSALSWAEQRYQQPELDYGESDDDDSGWQHVRPQAGGPSSGAAGYSSVVYNNPAADAWNEEDIQV